MDSVIEGLKCICECFGLFALEKKSQIFAMDDCFIHNFVTSGLLVISNIDSYSISNNGICFYLICRKSLLLRNRPNFGILNGLPCADCQFYLPALVDLSIAKEAAIAHAYPVVFISKLRPCGIFKLAAYFDIIKYAVFLLENPAPLLTFLPSPTLVLHNVICIV